MKEEKASEVTNKTNDRSFHRVLDSNPHKGLGGGRLRSQRSMVEAMHDYIVTDAKSHDGTKSAARHHRKEERKLVLVEEK